MGRSLKAGFLVGLEARAHLQKARRKSGAARRLGELEEYEDAISRAYYAMFHAAKATLIELGVNPKTHEGVLKEVGRLLVKPEAIPKRMGRYLAVAKALRERCDNIPSSEVDQGTASRMVKEAEEFLEVIENYLKRER